MSGGGLIADSDADWPLSSVLLFLYSADGGEPVHVHIERDDRIAKWWLGPARLAESGGFRPRELREIERIVRDNEAALMDAWHDFFDN